MMPPNVPDKKCQACGEPATDGLMKNGDWVSIKDCDYYVCRDCASGPPEDALEAINGAT